MHLNATRSSWDGFPLIHDVSLKVLDAKTITRFVDRAVQEGRLPYEYNTKFHGDEMRTAALDLDKAMLSALERVYLVADERLAVARFFSSERTHKGTSLILLSGFFVSKQKPI